MTRVKEAINNYLKALTITVLICRNRLARWITNLPARNQSKEKVLNLLLLKVILKPLCMPPHSKIMPICIRKIRKSMLKKMCQKLLKKFSTKIIILKASITFNKNQIKFILIIIQQRFNSKLKSRKNMQWKVKKYSIN
jgi:hypothetical protein